MAKTNNLTDFFKDLINTLKIKLSSYDIQIKPTEVAGKILDIDENNSGSFVEDVMCFEQEGINAIKSIIVYNTIPEIVAYAYAGMTNLENIVLFEGITKINNNAFELDSKITSITLPKTLTYIGDNCFNGCSSLGEIRGGDNVEFIGKNALYNTPFLKNNIDNLLYIGNCLYICHKVPEDGVVILKEGTNGISREAFNNKNGLKEIVCPSGLKEMGIASITSNKDLKKIKLVSADDSGIHIRNGSINDNPNLETLYISNIRQVDYNIVSNCPKLKWIYILNDEKPSKSIAGVFYNVPSDTIFYVREELLEYWKTVINKGDLQPYSEDNGYDTK